MSFPPSSTRRAGNDRASSDRSRPGGIRVVLVSLVASVLLHLLAVGVYQFFVGRLDAPVTLLDAPEVVTQPEGLRVVELPDLPEPVPDPEAAEPLEEQPEDEPEPEEPEPEADAAAETDETPEEGPTVAEILRGSESGDARIWRPVAPERTALTPQQRARLRLRGRVDALSDSLLAEEERLRSVTDWTFTDEDGNRWGISPGRLHLGDTSVPLPFGFSAPPSVDDIGRSEWERIRRGAQREAVRESWRERAEAIRERRDAERADSTGTDN